MINLERISSKEERARLLETSLICLKVKYLAGKKLTEYGLIDGIGGLWGLSKDIHEELKLEGNFRKLKFIKLKKDFSFSTILENIEDPSALAEKAALKIFRPWLLAI